MVASPYFENGIIVLILANCVSLALFRPYELEEPGSWNWTLGWIENVFNFCFTGEIVVRLVARGKVRGGRSRRPQAAVRTGPVSREQHGTRIVPRR